MRIEEMRSGRVYLSRRVVTQEPKIEEPRWESEQLEELFREIFPESEFELELTDGVSPLAPSSELDEPKWALVSFTGIEAAGLTYHQAARLVDVLGDNGVHGLSIITVEAAERLHK